VNEYQPGLIYMAVSRHGYVGAVRVENDQLNVAAAFDQRFLRECGGPAAAARHVFDEAGLPRVPELDAAHWRGTPPLTRRARPVAQHRLILIGDAAGYVEPFTGEGMAWALDSGRAAARHVHQSIEQWDRAASIAWENGYARTFAAAQRRCAIVSRAIRHPLIPYIGVRALRVLPALARPIVHSLNVSDREEVGA
jgi:flavin-dependent dehydrogenase